MAVTRLSDLSFDEDVYLSYAQENRPDRNAYVQSGVAVTNDSLREAVTEQGTLPTIPYWKDLDASSENVSSDDPNTSATPGKIGTDIMVARQLYLNNGWGAANLAASINGGNDPMRQIAARTGRYWDMRLAARVQAATLGAYLSNVAAGGDMVYDVSTEDGDNATADNKWSYDGFVDTLATMGENASELGLIAVHPDTMAQMRKQNQIATIQDSETGLMINMYGEYRVIEDKALPVIAGGTSGFRYVSVLYRQGAIGYAEGDVKNPIGVQMDEAAANGAGVESLWERKHWIVHPEGFNWTETTVAGLSPTITEFEDADNWGRKFERENVGLAFFVHN